MNFRFVIMPTVVTLLALRAGLKDARDGQPAFLWAILSDPARRPQLLRQAVKDLARICLMALVLDTSYQLLVLHEFHVAQALIVAVTCALLPYALFRGPTTRLARALSSNSQESPRTALTTPRPEGPAIDPPP